MSVKVFSLLIVLVVASCDNTQHIALNHNSWNRKIIDAAISRVADDRVQRVRPCPPCPCDTTVVEPPNSGAGILAANKSVVIERPEHFGGFIPTVNHVSAASKRSHLSTPMPELDYMPENPEQAKDVFIIYPDAINSWADVPFDNPDIRLFLFTKGDYVRHGVLHYTRSAPDDQRVVFRYYDPEQPFENVHAYDLAVKGRAAVLEGFQYGGKGSDRKPVHNFSIYQLAFIGNSKEKDGIKYGSGIVGTPGSSNITIDFCYFYRSGGMRLFGHNVWAQNNADLGRVPVRGDIGGIGIYTNEQYGSFNCGIVGNEIDHTDAIGLPRDGRNENNFKTVDGTIIADNHIYNAEAMITEIDGELYACGGEAIDAKNGSSDSLNPVRIFENVIADMYPTTADVLCGDNTGSIGGGIILHKYQQNTLVHDNIIARSTRGIDITGSRSNIGRETSNIVVYNNLIAEPIVRELCNNGRKVMLGSGVKMNSNDSDAYFNTIIGANEAFVLDKTRKTNQKVFGNRMISCNAGEPVQQYKLLVGDNFFSANSDISLSDLTVDFYRYTRPNYIVLESCIVSDNQLDVIANRYTESSTMKVISNSQFGDLILNNELQ